MEIGVWKKPEAENPRRTAGDFLGDPRRLRFDLLIEPEAEFVGLGGSAEPGLGRVFAEFAQVGEPVAKPNRGWGLGLAIWRRIANFIGASISVESKLGEGTEFTVRLPPDAVMDIASGASAVTLQATDAVLD
mgnify:CR=1 FL=1